MMNAIQRAQRQEANRLAIIQRLQEQAAEIERLRAILRRTLVALRNAPVSGEIMDLLESVPVEMLDSLFGPLDGDAVAEQAIATAEDFMTAVAGGNDDKA